MADTAGARMGAIYYEVDADTQKLIDGLDKAEKSLDRLKKSMSRIDGAAPRVEFQLDRVSAAARNMGRESGVAASSVSGLTRVIGGLLTLQGANVLIQMAEGYNEMAERVRMATGSQEEFEMVQQRLLKTANGTYRALSEAQEVYIRTADSLRSMGYETEQALDITDSLSYSFVTNATSADRAKNAITAFSKTINKGKTDVDAWETLISAVPSIINDIAAASGRTTAEIRELGATGKITSQMLTEGLRGSFEANKKAADDMLTTVRDAMTNLRNNLGAYLHEVNTASGATQTLSKGIIKLGENIDTAARALVAIGAGALAAYIWSLGESVLASAKAVIAARAQAAEEVRLAKAHVAATQAALIQAQALAALSAMQAGARTAADAHSAALLRLAAAKRAATTAGAALLGALGGPAGIAAMVAVTAASLYLFRDAAKSAAVETYGLAGAVEGLHTEVLKLRDMHIADRLEELEKLAEQMRRNVEWSERYAKAGGKEAATDHFKRRLQEERAALAQNLEEMEKLRKRRVEIDAELSRRAAAPTGAPETPRDPDADKRLKDMNEELELLKLQGEARARLQAIQKLGENANDAQKKEAADLAAQIYQTEQRLAALKKREEEVTAARKRDVEVLSELSDELKYASLRGEELAVAKAKAKLSEFATPEEIARVEELARQIYRSTDGLELYRDLQEQLTERQRQFNRELEAFGGGDRARELAAALAEVEDRYADLINQRRASSKGLTDEELGQIRDAQAEELRMVRDHYAAMKEVQADWSLGAVDAVRNYVDEASNLYAQVGNAVSGAFQSMEDALVGFVRNGKINFRELADSIIADLIRIQVRQQIVGLVSSFGSYFGGTSPQYGAVDFSQQTATGPVQYTGLSGNRKNGGPVSAGKMYRVNENGDPEILNTNGKQYLMMNQSRGQVTPMQDARGGSSGGGTVVQVINNSSQPSRQERGRTADGRDLIRVFIGEAAKSVAENGQLAQAIQGTYAMQRKPR